MNRKYVASVCYVLFFISFLSVFKTGWYGIIAFMTFLILGIYNMNKYQKEKRNGAKEYIDNFKKQFNFDDFDTTHNGLQGLILEKEKGRIGILNRTNLNNEFEIDYIEFIDISDVHIIKNESSIIKSSKSDLIGKSIIGGVLLGGTGAVIGALSSDKTKNEMINSIKLQIIVNDIVNPIRNITIADYPHGVKNNSVVGNAIYGIADKWFKRITLIIKNNNKMII